MSTQTRRFVSIVKRYLLVSAIVSGSAAPLRAQGTQSLTFSEPIVIPASETRAALATLKPTDRNIDKVIRTLATGGRVGHISVAVIAHNARPDHQYPGTANAHTKTTEVFHVLKGSATFAIGGGLEAPTALDPASESAKKLVGPGYTGPVKGNKTITVVAGDTLILPPMTPHEITHAEQGFEMLVLRLDPERLIDLQ